MKKKIMHLEIKLNYINNFYKRKNFILTLI